MRAALLRTIAFSIAPLCATVAWGQTLMPTGSLRISPSAEALLQQVGRSPTWSGDALISVEKNLSAAPVIHSFDASGVEIAPITVTIPGAKTVYIDAVVRGADGAYAVVGGAFDQDVRDHGAKGFVTWISPDRQTVKTGRPFPYYPHMVTIAPDGSIWTVGAETVNGVEKDPAVNRSHGVVRHFDTRGAQIGSFIPRSQVFGGKWLGIPQGDMVSNGDRVGWYARIAQQYTEVTFDGKVTTYAGIFPSESHSLVFGLALMDDGEVTATVPVSEPGAGAAVYRLDRTSRAWTLMPTPAHAKPYILGSDGKRVMFQGTTWGTYQLISISE
jgi:hypothetical protein